MQFKTIQQALDCFPNCLLCKKKLSLSQNYSGGVNSLSFYTENLSSYDPFKIEREIKIVIQDNSYIDEFFLDLDSSRVKRRITEKINVVSGFDSIQSTVTFHSSYPITSGTKYISFGINCSNCGNYSYLLQIIVDLGSGKIEDVILNSEVCLFNNKILNTKSPDAFEEIKNIYTTKETWYRISNSNPEVKVQKFPLIPLDRDDPRKTLNRINKLLIFT